jgi:hypothetical protein
MAAVTVAARTTGDPLALAALAQQAVRAIDANVPISDVRSLEQVMSTSVARPRLIMALLLVFAGVGTVLGAVGVYGVIAYAVGERRREIGVRIALGAEPSAVAAAVVLRGVRYAAIGVGVGLAGALAVTRVMRNAVVRGQRYRSRDIRRLGGAPDTDCGTGELLTRASGVDDSTPWRRCARIEVVIPSGAPSGRSRGIANRTGRGTSTPQAKDSSNPPLRGSLGMTTRSE